MAVDPKMYSMEKGWIVEYEDGKVVSEYDDKGNRVDWKKVPKRNIKSLTLKWHNKHWTITDKKIYIQCKRAWISPGMSVPVIEERKIGYWDGSSKVMYCVNENTGEMRMKVE